MIMNAKQHLKSTEIKKPKTKTDKVLAHLIRYGSINTWVAITKYKATRLSAIIFNLRKYGYNIESVEKQNNLGCRFVQYHIREVRK